jgi:dienelactone hydrolase
VSAIFDITPEWAHVAYIEAAAFQETYGFSGSQGTVNLEGIRFLPVGVPARTLLIYMHPATTLQLLPMPRAVAERGVHVLCAASRYARNDTALTYEAVLRDLGTWVRHAREVWCYEKVVLGGWSGGGSLMMYYQAQAERPTVMQTPAGDPADMAAARLMPADAITFQAAHVSRAELLLNCIDPSVRDEANPDDRDPELDLYDPANPNRPPFSAEYLARFRAAQRARMDRITARVHETLDRLRRTQGDEVERTFVTHRTLADPRFLDLTIEPNDRPLNRCWIGVPRVANTAPAGLGRVSTLRAWLSQWSIADSLADGEASARSVTVPILSIENGADEAVPQPHTGRIHAAAASADKTFRIIPGATHYYAGQPELLTQAVDLVTGWMQERGL